MHFPVIKQSHPVAINVGHGGNKKYIKDSWCVMLHCLNTLMNYSLLDLTYQNLMEWSSVILVQEQLNGDDASHNKR